MSDKQKNILEAGTTPAPDTSFPPCEVFRVGTHTTASGECISYSAADLDAIAESYDSANAPAPIVVGHPTTNAPAYGWLKSFRRVGDKLIAVPDKVDAAFSALVKDGKFKKVSMAFFRPDEASNPKPGVWYPRHVGFLGAAAPAVPGLKPVSFVNDQGVVEFEAYALTPAGFAGILRRMRDFLIDQLGVEKAGGVVSERDIEDLYKQVGIDSVTPADQTDNPLFNASGAASGGSLSLSSAGSSHPAAPTHFSSKESNEMSEQDKQELERLRAENARLKQQQQEAARETCRAEFAALTETLKADGRLPAATAAGVIEFALSLNGEQAVEFTAADGKKINRAQWFKDFLLGLPQSIPMGEAGKKSTQDAPAPVAFVAPAGTTVDNDRAALHAKAVSYQTSHKCDYLTAARAVGA